MTQPWEHDACSLVEAYRAGDHTPEAEMEATLSAIVASQLNAFSHVDAEGAMQRARSADINAPFGGVPFGIKELDKWRGWPDTEASVVFKDRIATYSLTYLERLVAAGCVPVGLTTASEFGGVNLTRTVLNGVTRNPWNVERTPGGSSGGSAAAVAGGLVPLASGGDGGGSIRIPAGFCGLPGLKTTYGRIPRGPHFEVGALTVTVGTLARSVRDLARTLDVCNGVDRHDPHSLPRTEGWERNLGSSIAELRGKRVAILDSFAGAVVSPHTSALVRRGAEELIADLGLIEVEVAIDLPNMGTAWSLANLTSTFKELGDAWPACADDLTPEMRFAHQWGDGKYDTAARIKLETRRTALFEAMATLFEQTDLVITSSNPDIAFSAEGPLPGVFGGIQDSPANNGKLTIPSNMYGNPAVSIPVGQFDGLPVGMQVLAPHHREAWLLDCAFVVEQQRPWPLVVPGHPL